MARGPYPRFSQRKPRFPQAGFSLFPVDETIFTGRAVIRKQTGPILSASNDGDRTMLNTIFNAIYRHFVVTAIVGMAMTTESRR